MRSERTRRKVKYSPLLRVRVRRMNMGPHGSGVRCLVQDINLFLWHYIGFPDDIKQLREKIGEIATIPYLIKAHGG